MKKFILQVIWTCFFLQKCQSLISRMDIYSVSWVDMVLVVIEGVNRDMGTTYRLLNEVLIPNIQADRILVAINQSDVAMKGRHWDENQNCPDEVLENFLQEQAVSIQRRVKEATGVDIVTPQYTIPVNTGII